MKLHEEEIVRLLTDITGWQLENNQIVRDFQFADFKTALAFVNRVAGEAEAMDHHPDILLHGWNRVRLSVMTHSEGGLTTKDFQLAERINSLGD